MRPTVDTSLSRSLSAHVDASIIFNVCKTCVGVRKAAGVREVFPPILLSRQCPPYSPPCLRTLRCSGYVSMITGSFFFGFFSTARHPAPLFIAAPGPRRFYRTHRPKAHASHHPMGDVMRVWFESAQAIFEVFLESKFDIYGAAVSARMMAALFASVATEESTTDGAIQQKEGVPTEDALVAAATITGKLGRRRRAAECGDTASGSGGFEDDVDEIVDELYDGLDDGYGEPIEATVALGSAAASGSSNEVATGRGANDFLYGELSPRGVRQVAVLVLACSLLRHDLQEEEESGKVVPAAAGYRPPPPPICFIDFGSGTGKAVMELSLLIGHHRRDGGCPHPVAEGEAAGAPSANVESSSLPPSATASNSLRPVAAPPPPSRATGDQGRRLSLLQQRSSLPWWERCHDGTAPPDGGEAEISPWIASYWPRLEPILQPPRAPAAASPAPVATLLTNGEGGGDVMGAARGDVSDALRDALDGLARQRCSLLGASRDGPPSGTLSDGSVGHFIGIELAQSRHDVAVQAAERKFAAAAGKTPHLGGVSIGFSQGSFLDRELLRRVGVLPPIPQAVAVDGQRSPSSAPSSVLRSFVFCCGVGFDWSMVQRILGVLWEMALGSTEQGQGDDETSTRYCRGGGGLQGAILLVKYADIRYQEEEGGSDNDEPTTTVSSVPAPCGHHKGRRLHPIFAADNVNGFDCFRTYLSTSWMERGAAFVLLPRSRATGIRRGR